MLFLGRLFSQSKKVPIFGLIMRLYICIECWCSATTANVAQG